MLIMADPNLKIEQVDLSSQPVLQQEPSIINTNPQIKSKIGQEQVIYDFKDTKSRMSVSVVGFIDDLNNKPSDKNWFSYLYEISVKDERYNYLGSVALFLVLFIILVK